MELSDGAEAVWDDPTLEYLNGGFPNYKVWNFSFERGSPVANELHAHDLIAPFAQGAWRLTFTGLQSILEFRDISDEADAKLDAMGREWRENGFPPVYRFAIRQADATIFNELIARGFFEPFTVGAVKLTDYEKRYLLKHRSDTL